MGTKFQTQRNEISQNNISDKKWFIAEVLRYLQAEY